MYIMKKKIALLLTICLSFALFTGCGDKDNTDKTGTDTNNISADTDNESAEYADVHLNDYVVEDLVTLGQYTGFEVTVAAPAVSEALQQMYVDNIYSSYLTPEMGITDREVAVGDNTYISYVGKLDGVAFDGGTSEGTFLEIGSGNYIDGFEDGLVGVMPGETVDLNLTFPEGYQNEDLAGKAVVFTVTVHYIEPEMSDVAIAAMNNPDFSNVEELNNYVYENLMAQAEYNYNVEIENKIIEQLLANTTFNEIPEDLVAKYTNNARENLTATAAQYGYDLGTYTLMYYGADAETIVAAFGTDSAKQIIALKAIANIEGMSIDDAQLDERLQEQVEITGAASLEEFLGETDKEDWRDFFMASDVIAYIIENSTVITE